MFNYKLLLLFFSLARIESSMDHDFQVYTFHARKANWLFMLIIGLLGGLGLFLLGMVMLSERMKNRPELYLPLSFKAAVHL